MHLAINYSPAAAELVQSGQITVDYFKTPNWEWMVREASLLRPVAVHFNLEAGNGSLGEVDWDAVRQLSDLTKTPYINLHLDARQSYYPDFSVATSTRSEVEAVTKVILSDILMAVDRFGPERVIVENSPYHAIEGNTMQLSILPELITRVVDETGCGLLLDISHAVIAANSIGMDPEVYISGLPVHKVKELHFAGIHHNQATGELVDHLSIQPENWRWLDLVLNQVRCGEMSWPWLLAFEYGGVGEPFNWRSNPAVIAEQVPELYEHLGLLNANQSARAS